MATLLSITKQLRDGMTPGGGRCQGQLALMLPAGIPSCGTVSRAERSAGLAALTAQYYRRWQPVATDERLLVDLLVAADWQLRRLQAGRQWRPPEPA